MIYNRILYVVANNESNKIAVKNINIIQKGSLDLE